MIHADLINDIAALSFDAVKHSTFPTELGDNVAINVFRQYLPLDLFEQTSYYPLVLVELLSATDSLKKGSSAQIGITIGTYSEQNDAYLDAFHIMECIRTRLLSNRIVNHRWQLLDESSWEPAQSQPSPFFILYGFLSYELFLPQDVNVRRLL